MFRVFIETAEDAVKQRTSSLSLLKRDLKSTDSKMRKEAILALPESLGDYPITDAADLILVINERLEGSEQECRESLRGELVNKLARIARISLNRDALLGLYRRIVDTRESLYVRERAANGIGTFLQFANIDDKLGFLNLEESQIETLGIAMKDIPPCSIESVLGIL